MTAVDDPEMTLVVRLLYGSGMRAMKAARLRMKDVDVARREILTREGKGNKDRVTMLPVALREALCAKVKWRALQQAGDLALGIAKPVSPHTLSHSLATHLADADQDIRGVTFYRRMPSLSRRRPTRPSTGRLPASGAARPLPASA